MNREYFPSAMALLLLLLVPVFGCGDDGSSDEDDGGIDSGDDAGIVSIEPTYANIQTRVFDASCAFSSCHDDSQPSQGLDLVTDAHGALVNVMATGGRCGEDADGSACVDDRVLVIPGDPDNSYLMEKVESMTPTVGGRMPVGGQELEAYKVEALRAWIAAGATTD